MPVPSITQLTVVATILVIHLLLLLILGYGLSVLQKEEQSFGVHSLGRPMFLWRILVVFSVVGMVPIVISEDFYPVWEPAFPSVVVPTVSAPVTLAFYLCFAWMCSTVFVARTGGSINSPFTPVLVALPALAIFLRAAPTLFISVAAAVAIVYLLTAGYSVPPAKEFESRAFASSAHKVVTLSMLGLAMLVGFVTRPVPVDQLPSSRATASPLAQPSALGSK